MADRHVTSCRVSFCIRPEVRRELAKLNISQNQLARKCSLSSGYLSQLFTGTRHPGPDVRQRLMTALGVAFDDLFEEVE